MNEAGRKQELVKLVRSTFPALVVLRHEDLFTAGIPDISIHRGRLSLWLEAKYDELKTYDLQRETLRSLQGFFVLYRCDKITEVLTPDETLVISGRLHEPVLAFIEREFKR